MTAAIGRTIDQRPTNEPNEFSARSPKNGPNPSNTTNRLTNARNSSAEAAPTRIRAPSSRYGAVNVTASFCPGAGAAAAAGAEGGVLAGWYDGSADWLTAPPWTRSAGSREPS